MNITSAPRKGRENYVGFFGGSNNILFWSFMADIDSQIHCVTHGKGKKFVFELFLLLGYACGIARKIMQTVDGSS